MGRITVARELFDRADAASEHIGDGAGTVLAHYGQGLLALEDGELDEAERRFILARDGFAVLGTPVWEGWALVTLARCREIRDGRLPARELYETALGLGRRAGEPGLTASALEGLTRTWAPEEADRAAALEAEAADVRERLGRPRPHYQDTWTSTEGDDSPASPAQLPGPSS